MNIKEFSFPSATGVATIHGNTYTPEDVKAVLVIHHGMAEHSERYIEFIKYMVSNGIAIYMYDMANHGKSNNDFAISGFFGKMDGYKGLVDDLNTEFKMAREAYPDKKIIVMGHSMGSFVTRCFTAWYHNAGFDGAIYMGTGGPNPIAGLGDKLSAVIAKATGYTKKVKLLDTMAFGKYNEKTEKRTAFDWLTRDDAIVDKYIADDYCGFLFSAQGMNDLLKLTINSNSNEWAGKVPDVPILVISGGMDPVGEYGKGVKAVGEMLAQSGHTRLTVKIYDGARHEILNETNKDEVYSDILCWINAI